MSRVTDADVRRALVGLTNPVQRAPHPVADRVIRQLWAEVQSHRSKTPLRDWVFERGDDYDRPGGDHTVYGISVTDPDERPVGLSPTRWGNRIEVYGSAELRDRVLDVLRRESARGAGTD